MIARLIASAAYMALCWLLGLILLHVMGPMPDWIIKLYKWKWKGTVMGYFTVRYENDEQGLWQIIEESATGNRYRVQVRNAKGDMKW
jgi:hypothetical protein